MDAAPDRGGSGGERRESAGGPVAPRSAASLLRSPAVADAVAVNALPVVGILALHWDLLAIVFYYLLAECVAGLVALAQIVRCADPSPESRGPDLGGATAGGRLFGRRRFLTRTAWIVVLEAIVAFALSDGVVKSQGVWVVVALVILGVQGIAYYRRFMRDGRWRVLTCAEVEVGYYAGFGLFLAMVTLIGLLAWLGVSDGAAAATGVIVLILACAAIDVWRALGLQSRLMARAYGYAAHLAAVDAGADAEAEVEPDDSWTVL